MAYSDAKAVLAALQAYPTIADRPAFKPGPPSRYSSNMASVHNTSTPAEYHQSLLIISPVTRRAATWPLVLELKFFLSNNVRMSTATEMCLPDHNSNNCTNSGNVSCCTHMVNNDYDKFRSFSSLYTWLYFGIELAHICMVEPTDFLFQSPMVRWQHSVSGHIIKALISRSFYTLRRHAAAMASELTVVSEKAANRLHLRQNGVVAEMLEAEARLKNAAVS